MTESITTASYLGQLVAPAKLAEGGFVINGVTRLVFLQKEMKKNIMVELEELLAVLALKPLKCRQRQEMRPRQIENWS